MPMVAAMTKHGRLVVEVMAVEVFERLKAPDQPREISGASSAKKKAEDDC